MTKKIDELLEALTIMSRYMDKDTYPTYCTHDVMNVCADPEDFTEDELQRLEDLGFYVSDEGHFYSFRWGSC